MKKSFFTSHELANILDIPHERVLRWITSGKLPAKPNNDEYIIYYSDWKKAIKTHLLNKA